MKRARFIFPVLANLTAGFFVCQASNAASWYFERFGAKLPAPTQLCIQYSYWALVVAIVYVLVCLPLYLKVSDDTKLIVLDVGWLLAITMPLVGLVALSLPCFKWGIVVSAGG